MTSFFDKRSSGRIKKPIFMALYSGPGVGKTDFAASFPSPHFFDFEESTDSIDVSRSRPTSFDEMMDDLEEIKDADNAQGIETLAFDTIDEFERLIHRHVAAEAKKAHIENIGWQKGYDMAVNHWADFINICREIRDKHKMHFVFLAHSTGRSFTDLEQGESFSRHAMCLHKKASEYFFGQVEMVLFAKKDIAIKIVDEKVIAKDVETRILCTSLSAHYDAKNRIGLPPAMAMPYKNGFQVLSAAYEKAFNETPDVVYKECCDLIESVQIEETRKSMQDYCDKHKGDLAILRATLQRIKENLGVK